MFPTQSSIVRLGILLLLFDVYLTWARIEKQTVPISARGEGANLGSLAQQSIVSQYFFFRTFYGAYRGLLQMEKLTLRQSSFALCRHLPSI